MSASAAVQNVRQASGGTFLVLAAAAFQAESGTTSRYAKACPGLRRGRGKQLSLIGSAPATTTRSASRLRLAALFCLVMLIASQLGMASVQAAGARPASPQDADGGSPAAPKMVIVVGPTDSLTAQNLADAESLAQVAESLGVNVVRLFHPNATWDQVVAEANGANLFVYLGHGNGWPSPYAPFQEDTKDGIGINPYSGGSKSNTQYHGGNQLRTSIQLAPNAIVFLNHLCYAAGNAEPGMAIPGWDVAHQRNDNFAAGFMAMGARTVFAYSWQLFNKTMRDLMTTDETMQEIFETPGSHPKAYYGFIGDDARMFDSVRTPGTVNYLDKDPKDGFLRAISGDLSMTAGQWRGDEPTGNLSPITIPDINPTTPTDLTATPYNNRVVKLTWTPPTTNMYDEPRYYRVPQRQAIAKGVKGASFTDQGDESRTPIGTRSR